MSLSNRTPDEVRASGKGGGVRIADKFGGAREASPAQRSGTGDASRAKTGQRCAAASAVMDVASIQAKTVLTIGSTLVAISVGVSRTQ